MEKSITYCTEELQKVWHAAEKMYNERYPKLPYPSLTCTYRSSEEQDKLYNQPHDNIDNDRDHKIDEKDEFVTRAKGGHSYHNTLPAKAFDVVMRNRDTNKADWTPEAYKIFAAVVLSINPKVIWGGNWKSIKDLTHFELH